MAFISTAIAAVGAWIGGLTWASVGTFLLKSALSMGLSLLAQKLSGKKPKGPSFGVKGRLERGADLPQTFTVGKYATAGSLTYANTSSTGDKDGWLTWVITLSDLPVTALLGFWVNGAKCEILPLDVDGWQSVVGYQHDNGNYHLRMRFYDGTQVAADDWLTDVVSTAERPWGADAVGYGKAYAVVRAYIDREMFPNGFPSFLFEIEGVPLYDPSRDTSVGGSGAHRWDDPATWESSENPAVQLYNILRGIHYDGEWLYGLQDVAEAQLPVSHWITQINKCASTIEGADGLEPRFRSSAEIPVDAEIHTVIESLLDACNGRLSDAGGVYKLFSGAPDAPVMSFTDEDILSTSEQSFTPFLGLADTVNGVAAKYPSPAAGWQIETAPPLYRPDYEAEDGGRRLLVDVSLDFVPYAEQAQRLMKSALNEARRARRHTFTLPPKYWPLEPGDVVSWTSERNGYAGKQFRVDGVIDLPNGDVIVDLTEIDPADYDFDTAVDFTPPVIPSILPQPIPVQEVQAFTVTPAILKDAAGADRRPAIRATWNGDIPDVRAIKLELRIKATGEQIDPARSDTVADGEVFISAGIIPATEYEVRAKFVPASARPTEWTIWKSVTSPDVRVGEIDLEQVIKDNIQDAKDAADQAAESATIANQAADAVRADYDALVGGFDGTLPELEVDFAAAEAAAAAAEVARAAAATAQGLAESAANGSEAAKTAAELARGQAQTAKTASEAAQAAAETARTAAETARDNSESFRDAADAAAAAADTAKTDAQIAATSADGSATAAAGHASNAEASETAAGTSATAAQASSVSAGLAADDADAAANAASQSASAASTSQTAAGQSATAANSAKNEAQTAKGQAETARDAAATSEANAEGSASAASTSASNAAQSKTDAGASATAASDSASLAATKATEAGQSATAATNAKTDAETARGQAETARDEAATSETNAAGSAASALSSETVSAEIRDGLEADARLVERHDFNNGADFWLNGHSMTKQSMRQNPGNVTNNAAVTLVSTPTDGTVLRTTANYVIMSERTSRPFIDGQIFKLSVKTRLETDPVPGAGTHQQYAWLTGFTSDGSHSHYQWIATWHDLTVADGWAVRTVEFEPMERKAATTGAFKDAVEWRLMVGINGYDPDPGGAVQDISYIVLEDITSEKAAEASASASADSASAASASETAAGTSASAAQTAQTAAETAQSSAETSATAASTSETNAEGSAASASTSASNAASSENAAGDSATAAATSATTASTHADDASQSASAAEASAIQANTKAGEASVSAANAATSEVNAAGSASSAQTQAGLAASSKDGAEDAATAAATQAGIATTKADEAGTSATAATAAKTAAETARGQAQTSASNASTSEDNAAGSASLAGTHATAAASSATDAGNSATAAAGSASTAATKATEAGTSATAANSAKNQAQTARSQAQTAATNAATSETNADGSAQAAASSAISASVFKDDAEAQADIAISAVASMDNKLESLIAMRVIAGTAEAELELVAADNPDGPPESIARIAATNIILEGSVTAEEMAANSVLVDSILINDRLELDAVNAGFVMGKQSAYNMSDDGIYMGRTEEDDGAMAGFGFHASKTDPITDRLQSLSVTYQNGLQIINARHYRELVSSSDPVLYTTSQTIDLDPSTTEVDLAFIAGGSGGAGGPDRLGGGVGGTTTVELYDGATLINSWSASGGGGRGGSSKRYNGRKGDDSVLGTGGAGGLAVRHPDTGNVISGNPGDDATGYGAGGGGASGSSASSNGANGGTAGGFGEAQSVSVVGLTDPKLTITIGSGGAGEPAGSSLYYAGGDGSPGRVSVTQRGDTLTQADVIPLEPQFSGVINKTGLTTIFPDLGAGLWILSVTGTSHMDVGYVEISPGVEMHLRLGTTATFVSSQTPVRMSGGHGDNRTIVYQFFKMGD